MLLYYITGSQTQARRADWLSERVVSAARGGVDWIQLREKDLSARQLFELATALKQRLARTPGHRARLLINDRLDIALAARLDGVHLPAAGLAPADIASRRDLVPPEFLLVVSCHSPAEVFAAARAGAHAAVLGPIFATPSKAGQGEPLGPAVLQVAREVSMPVLALGGITPHNAAECLAAGAAGLAGIRLFQEAEPAGVCAALRRLTASPAPG